ncbi:MAG: hypothetical protein UW94_C0004G0032 [Parcubacteria group bacterium GW2011_GWA2_45_14]|nr:MAG: hypothetical protein UW94_C0004G0032 [Parcubacteria group bacterium GW2011_GWA2_45_14]
MSNEAREDKVANSVLDARILNYVNDVKPEEIGFLKEKITSLDVLVPEIRLDEDLISLDNCPQSATETFKAIHHNPGIDMPTAFVIDLETFLDNLKKNKPEEFDKLQEAFKDSVVVDLGAGDGVVRPNRSYEMACLLGAKGYIGVETYNFQSLVRSYLRTKKLRVGYEPIPFNLVAEDAVSFMKRLPDKSVNLLNSGIGDILTEDSYKKDYQSEMERVLKVGGICLISNSLPPSGNHETIYSTGYVSETESTKPHSPITILKKSV